MQERKGPKVLPVLSTSCLPEAVGLYIIAECIVATPL